MRESIDLAALAYTACRNTILVVMPLILLIFIICVMYTFIKERIKKHEDNSTD